MRKARFGEVGCGWDGSGALTSGALSRNDRAAPGLEGVKRPPRGGRALPVRGTGGW